MQKVYLRNKPKQVAEYPSLANEKILHFSLQDSLPAGHTLVLNTTFGTLSYLSCENGMPRLVRQEQFTNTEMSVLMPLLEMFPYYCPYEVLYGSFYGDGKISEANTARGRERLEQAEIEGTWDQELRPIRCALSRTRLKIRAFGIDISSILATGYILLVSGQSIREEAMSR
ncbi:hypothetical protein [Tengunoibacter tsumagoiensis]|uniref:Uncharacterized protein n=1 Tax=Tengunoibacter tsumagoiensis TaxID=2014871 RepID=A0A401ZXF4_9CHLR|nr:hypothetical protein [Tengunoibacter tsumagoiensis]GCE11522.1 hypothetical protein KTT_13810 [Tengunoibacter tsumagoiensis]